MLVTLTGKFQWCQLFEFKFSVANLSFFYWSVPNMILSSMQQYVLEIDFMTK